MFHGVERISFEYHSTSNPVLEHRLLEVLLEATTNIMNWWLTQHMRVLRRPQVTVEQVLSHRAGYWQPLPDGIVNLPLGYF